MSQIQWVRETPLSKLMGFQEPMLTRSLYMECHFDHQLHSQKKPVITFFIYNSVGILIRIQTKIFLCMARNCGPSYYYNQ